METGVATQNIHAYVAGEHGDSEVALWSSAEIGNVPLRHWGPTLSGKLFDAELRQQIALDVVNSAYKIIEARVQRTTQLAWLLRTLLARCFAMKTGS